MVSSSRFETVIHQLHSKNSKSAIFWHEIVSFQIVGYIITLNCMKRLHLHIDREC